MPTQDEAKAAVNTLSRYCEDLGWHTPAGVATAPARYLQRALQAQLLALRREEPRCRSAIGTCRQTEAARSRIMAVRYSHSPGETKRERAARSAMQGLFACGPHDCTYREILEDAVKIADALYDELEKGGSDEQG